MFIIGGFGYIVPAIVFWCFGSADVQSWNDINKENDISTQESQEQQKSHDDPEMKSTISTENKQTKF